MDKDELLQAKREAYRKCIEDVLNLFAEIKVETKNVRRANYACGNRKNAWMDY